jgi:hypothetical protein
MKIHKCDGHGTVDRVLERSMFRRDNLTLECFRLHSNGNETNTSPGQASTGDRLEARHQLRGMSVS